MSVREPYFWTTEPTYYRLARIASLTLFLLECVTFKFNNSDPFWFINLIYQEFITKLSSYTPLKH